MHQLEQFGQRMSSFSDGGFAAPRERERERRLSLGPAVDEVLSRLHREAQARRGELLYLLCRSLRARRVVDFATSLGVSALYFAAAMRDNGGGTVISAELVPQKIDAARRNLVAAGLDGYVDLLCGDARQTLADLSEPVDFALIDCRPSGDEPSLALEVFRVVAPQIRSGGLVLNDNAEPDYLAYVRDPANGFTSITLPLKRGTELSLKR